MLSVAHVVGGVFQQAFCTPSGLNNIPTADGIDTRCPRIRSHPSFRLGGVNEQDAFSGRIVAVGLCDLHHQPLVGIALSNAFNWFRLLPFGHERYIPAKILAL